MVALWRPYQREEWVSQDNYGGTFSLALPLKTCFYNVSRIFFWWVITSLFGMLVIWMVLILAHHVVHLIILALAKDSGSSIWPNENQVFNFGSNCGKGEVDMELWVYTVYFSGGAYWINLSKSSSPEANMKVCALGSIGIWIYPEFFRHLDQKCRFLSHFSLALKPRMPFLRTKEQGWMHLCYQHISKKNHAVTS